MAFSKPLGVTIAELQEEFPRTAYTDAQRLSESLSKLAPADRSKLIAMIERLCEMSAFCFWWAGGSIKVFPGK